MHSSACDTETPRLDGADVLVAIATLITEGRIPNTLDAKKRGFSEGPHCVFSKQSQGHICNTDNQLCNKYEKINSYVLSLWQRNIPLCIEVLLVPKCCCENDLVCNVSSSLDQIGSAILLEKWHFSTVQRRTHHSSYITVNQLINAVRSQLHFSQISAWHASPDESIRMNFFNKSIIYCLTISGETFGCTKFITTSQKHNFPTTDIGNGFELRVSLSNLPRTEEMPHLTCSKCDVPMTATTDNTISYLDDRMQTYCTLKGKHRCEDVEEYDSRCNDLNYRRTFFHLKCSCKSVKNSNDDTSKPSTSKTLKYPASSSFDRKYDKSKQITNGAESKGADWSKTPLELEKEEFTEVLNVLKHSGPGKSQKKNDLAKQSQGDILLDAILRSSKVHSSGEDIQTTQTMKLLTDEAVNNISMSETNFKRKCVHKLGSTNACVKNSVRGGDNKCICDNKNDYIISDNVRLGENHIYTDNNNCDKVKRKLKTDLKIRDISNVFSIENLEKRQKVKVKQKISFDDFESPNNCVNQEENYEKGFLSDEVLAIELSNEEDEKKDKQCKDVHSGIPSALEQAKFRKSLDSAASMVFHSRTGLPLTSSPAPVRRGKSCFDFDSSINSVSAIRSALFSLQNFSTDDDSESDGSIVSPCSPDALNGLKYRDIPPIKYHRKGQSAGLLGSFEESVLNGRLEPVSTVHGFTAELGASGSFCPRHVVLPVTVFFYTLGDNDKVSTPYLGHINLVKKGYNVPRSGTIQVTLFNPLGTVVKMFVIMYDLSDMPVCSQTFIRQRTLYMPANCDDKDLQWSQKWLRYLIHLRFMSSKSGRIYLHSDIRMIICRKSDLDTATAHGIDMSYELRSFTHCPSNPKFSPRK